MPTDIDTATRRQFLSDNIVSLARRLPLAQGDEFDRLVGEALSLVGELRRDMEDERERYEEEMEAREELRREEEEREAREYAEERRADEARMARAMGEGEP